MDRHTIKNNKKHQKPLKKQQPLFFNKTMFHKENKSPKKSIIIKTKLFLSKKKYKHIKTLK